MKNVFLRYLLGITFLLSLNGNMAFGENEVFCALQTRLTTFSAKIQENTLRLSWTTDSEINNKGFEIQKSLDKKSFQTLEFVKGNNGSKRKINYFFDDKNLPAFATLYYRVKQIAYDGTFQYSRTIEVSGQQLGILIIFPNPGDGVFSLSMGDTKSFELKIMDSKGHHLPILITNIKDSNDIIVHPQNALQSGFYQLKVISGDHMKLEMMKVMVE